MKRLVLVASLFACSNGSSPNDGGTSDVVTQDVTMGDVAADAPNDGSALTPPEALDQAGKLALWLEATPADVVVGDGGGVTAWKDKSKNKNDGAALGTSPTVIKSAIAAHDAVHFSQCTDTFTIADAPSLQLATDPFYIAAVTRVLTYRAFFFAKSNTDDGGTNPYAGLDFFTAPSNAVNDAGMGIPALYAYIDQTDGFFTWTGAQLGDGNYHIVELRRPTATTLVLTLDDLTSQTKTVAATDVSAVGHVVNVGQIFCPMPPDFSLVEDLVVHAPSDAEVAAVHAYLKQKYGL
jgi:hypothetical protein